MRVKPGEENHFHIECEGYDGKMDFLITIGNEEYEIHQKTEDRVELDLCYVAKAQETAVRIRFDKLSGHTPCLYTIKVV